MPIIKRRNTYRGLHEYEVLIDDTSPNSPNFFNVYDVPEMFPAGKTAFRINGSDNLIQGTEVLVEIIDRDNNVIYSEYPDYIEGTSRFVSVYVYPDYQYGEATITILGQIKDAPSEWKDKYSVRWQKNILINPELRNENIIRFYRQPKINATEYVTPYLKRIYESGSVLAVSGNVGGQYVGDEYQLLFESGFALNQDMIDGLVVIPNPDITPAGSGTPPEFRTRIAKINTNINAIATTVYQPTESWSPKFKSDQEAMTYHTRTYGVASRGLTAANFNPSPFTMSYDAEPTYSITDNLRSFAKVNVYDMTPFAGDIYSVKLFMKSVGQDRTFELVGDTILENKELLVDVNSPNVDQTYGNFYLQRIIDTYWSSSVVGTSLPAPQLIRDGNKIFDAMYISGSTSSYPYNEYYVIYPFQNIEIFNETEYTFEGRFYAVPKTKIMSDEEGERLSSKVTANLRIYMSGSAFKDTDGTDHIGRGKLIDEIEVNSPPIEKNLEYRTINFYSDQSGSGQVQFVVDSGDWYISEVSIKNSQETGFSPDTAIFWIPVPDWQRDDILEFQAEFYNILGDKANMYATSSETNFSGGNFYIEGDNNVITGSVFVGNAIGEGIEFAGINSAYIRNVGYLGYYHATKGTGPGGFMMWSGSVLPLDAPASYSAVGLEIHGGSGSAINPNTGRGETHAMRFRTDTGRLEITGSIYATDGFFSGSIQANRILVPLGGAADGKFFFEGAYYRAAITQQGYFFAQTGSIGGWIINSESLYNEQGNMMLSASGVISTSNFYVNEAGALTASDAVIYGDITAENITATGSGVIGGFSIDATTISSSNGDLILRANGQITASNALLEGTINAGTGSIGGWLIAHNFLSASNIILDSNGSIQTSNYVSDLKGWRITSDFNGFAEFENVKVRGTLRTTVFEKETVNAVGGQLWVANSTVISGSETASASPSEPTYATWSVENASGWLEDEIAIVKQVNDTGFTTEYIRVVSSSLDTDSTTKFNGKIYVERNYQGGLDWYFDQLKNPDTASLVGDSGSTAGIEYEPGQTVVSTGLFGSQFGAEYVVNGDFDNFTFINTGTNSDSLYWVLDQTYHQQENTGKEPLQSLVGNVSLSASFDTSSQMIGTNISYNGSTAVLTFDSGTYASSSGDDVFSLVTGSNWTIEGIASLDDVAGTQEYGLMNLINTDGFRIVLTTASLDFEYAHASASEVLTFAISPTSSITKDVPFSFAVTFDQSAQELKTYFNGLPYATTAESRSISSGSFVTGSDRIFQLGIISGSYWTGSVSELLITKNTLTDKQIKEDLELAKSWIWNGSGSVTNDNFDQLLSGSAVISQSITLDATRRYYETITTETGTTNKIVSGSSYTMTLDTPATYSEVSLKIIEGSTGYIRLNANPRDPYTPYIDIIERTGSNIYDLRLKTRIGDLSGLSPALLFGDDSPGHGIYTENGYFEGTVTARTGSFTGVVHAGNLYIGANVTASYDGIWINTNNYWFDNGWFKVGSDTQFIEWDGTTLNIAGDLQVSSIPNIPADGTNLRGYWSFNEGTGTTILDQSANQFTASLGSAASFNANGVNGNSIDIINDGNSYIEITSIEQNVFSATTYDHTFLIWLRPKGISTSGMQRMIGKVEETDSGDPLYFVISGSSGRLSLWDDSTVITNGTASLFTEDEWALYEFEFTSSGNVCNVYKNGDFRESFDISALTIPAWPHTFQFGSVQIAGSPHAFRYSGSIDEIRVYEFPLEPINHAAFYVNPKANTTRISGDQIRTGRIISNNWTGTTVGSLIELDDGTMMFGGSGSNAALYFDGADLYVSGTISASAGKIGGFSVSPDALYAGTQGSESFFISGSATGGGSTKEALFISSSDFQVSYNGVISASDGFIGGWTIAPSELESGDDITTPGIELRGLDSQIIFKTGSTPLLTIEVSNDQYISPEGSTEYLATTVFETERLSVPEGQMYTKYAASEDDKTGRWLYYGYYRYSDLPVQFYNFPTASYSATFLSYNNNYGPSWEWMTTWGLGDIPGIAIYPISKSLGGTPVVPITSSVMHIGVSGRQGRGVSGGILVGTYGTCNDINMSTGVLGEGRYRENGNVSSWSGIFRYNPFVIGNPFTQSFNIDAASAGFSGVQTFDDEYCGFVFYPPEFNASGLGTKGSTHRGRAGFGAWNPQGKLDVRGTITGSTITPTRSYLTWGREINQTRFLSSGTDILYQAGANLTSTYDLHLPREGYLTGLTCRFSANCVIAPAGDILVYIKVNGTNVTSMTMQNGDRYRTTTFNKIRVQASDYIRCDIFSAEYGGIAPTTFDDPLVVLEFET